MFFYLHQATTVTEVYPIFETFNDLTPEQDIQPDEAGIQTGSGILNHNKVA